MAGSACFGRKQQAGQKLKLSASKLLSMSSLYVAQESGYFRDAGLDLEIVQISNPLDAMTLLAGGKIDIAFAGMNTSFLNAALKGLPLRIVAGREIASPACGNAGVIYAMRSNFPRGLEDLSQLRGKRISAGPTIGISHFALDAQLESAGLSADDVTAVNLPSSQAAAALIGGSVDAIVINLEFDRILISKSAEIVRTPGLSRVHPDFQYSYIYFGKTLLEADPEIGAAFLSAYLRGAREFSQGSSPKYMEEFAKSNGLDFDQVKHACRNTFTLDGPVDMQSLQLFVDWAARRKYIPRTVAAAQFVDSRFLRRIHAH